MLGMDPGENKGGGGLGGLAAQQRSSTSPHVTVDGIRGGEMKDLIAL